MSDISSMFSENKEFPWNLAPITCINRQLSLEIKGGLLGNQGKMDIYKGLVPQSKEIRCLFFFNISLFLENALEISDIVFNVHRPAKKERILNPRT